MEFADNVADVRLIRQSAANKYNITLHIQAIVPFSRPKSVQRVKVKDKSGHPKTINPVKT